MNKLFNFQNPAELDDWLGDLNPNSKIVISDAYAVSALREAVLGDRFQFERLGMFGHFLLVEITQNNKMPYVLHGMAALNILISI